MHILLAASTGAALALGVLVVIVWAMKRREDTLRRIMEEGRDPS
jgi:hypothetical protein